MANTWFRLYHEFGSDPKVQMMSETDQRRLIMLMCLKCCNGNVSCNVSDETAAFYMRISVDEWQITKGQFLALNFIDNDNNLVNWEKRQFVSDSSTERVRKHRARVKKEAKHETLQKRSETVSCNAPEQNRTEQIYNNIPYRDIVAYLNQKSNKKFKHTTKETKRAIRARWNEGFRLDDFKRVIDVKSAKWGKDAKMVDYLRPQTLFGTKFEGYLNEIGPVQTKRVGVPPDAVRS